MSIMYFVLYCLYLNLWGILWNVYVFSRPAVRGGPALGPRPKTARPARGQVRRQPRAQVTDHANSVAPGAESPAAARKPGRVTPSFHMVGVSHGRGLTWSASYMVGIEKSAPARMPVGQREVMVFSLV